MKTIQNDGIEFICIDLFCGAGGVSTGLERARNSEGRKLAKVVACINHDPLAIESHEANHPEALHMTEDIRTAALEPVLDRLALERGRHPSAKVLLWASLECTNFSIAKGGLPKDADSRTLASHLFRYIDAIRPDYIIIENVREFMAWGDLDERGRPLSRDRGRDYVRWCNQVQARGYDFNWKLLNAADYGAHTSRTRYFGIFARHGMPIRFPAPTHARKPVDGMFGKLRPWNAVREVLNLDDEGQSIFSRKKPLVDRTLKRILAGLEKYVAGGDREWLVKHLSNSPTKGYSVGTSINDPSPTITCQARIALASVHWLIRYNNHNGGCPNKGASLDDPAPTLTTWPAVALAKVDFLQTYYGNGGHTSTDQPAPAVTTKDRIGKVTIKWLDKRYNGDHNHQPVSEPAGVVTTTPKFALISANRFITPTNYDAAPLPIDRPIGAITANRKLHYIVNPQYANTPTDVDRPIFTLIARMDKKPPILITTEAGGLAIRIDESDSPTMRKIKEFMATHGIVDIRMRMLRIDELMRITGFPPGYVLKGNQGDRKKFIGNAVPCVLPQRMVEALSAAIIKN